MNRQLAIAIGSVLACSAHAGLAAAQETTEAASDATPLEVVMVTGSLIPQIQQETASPVVAITAEDIARQGYQNVSDVLRAQPLSTGAIQDNQFSAGFTPGAQTISLLGLAPGFTLILLDGRPLADYPLLYNGQANFTDLSSIPVAMVERIDVLPGNQSAIYGSSAVAGVVNIILKKRIEGVQVAVRGGAYQEGGGDNLRFELTGGLDRDKFDLTYGFQYSRQEPVWGYQRERFDSTRDDPNDALHFGSRTFLAAHIDIFTSGSFATVYNDPGQAACAGISRNFRGTTEYDFRPGRGYYCGSSNEPGYTTYLNFQEGVSGYLNTHLRLTDNAELYASLLYTDNTVESNSGTRFWTPDVNGTFGFIWNDLAADGEPLQLYQHIFSPEETGGINKNNSVDDARSYNVALGMQGAFGDSNWDYDAYYARSEYEVDNRQVWPLTAEIEDFFREQFLGPQLGTYYGYPVYHPDVAAFYTSVTPDEYDSFNDTIRSKSTTWTHNVNFRVTNTNLFEMPAGPVGFAALAQAGKQSWENPTDPRVIAGDFWGLTGTQGEGEREYWATALEFRVPLFSALTANVSARYDDYQNVDAGGDSSLTYKAGLEYRPVESLLFRGSFATAFRAPDMAYVFAGDSGFFTSATDYYRCELEGEPLETCIYNPSSIQGSRIGNPDLKSITADSIGFGVVWSPSDSFQLRVDYYDIQIDDEVSDLSIDRLLRDENECRQGRLDINSPTCVDALARIERLPPTAFDPNALEFVTINPINISKESVSGILAGMTARFDAGRGGSITLNVDYNNAIDHEYTQYAGDEPIDLLSDGFNSTEFKSIVTADVVWGIGDWTTALHATRYGSTPNYAEQNGGAINGVEPGELDAWYLFNLNVAHQLTDSSALAVTVNNLLDEAPPTDRSHSGLGAYPYYNIFNYNGYGRALWVEFRMNFGGDSGD